MLNIIHTRILCLRLFLLSTAFLFNTERTHSQGTPEYSFFVAGHAYGDPMASNLGLYPVFKSWIDSINAHPNLELGLLAGDFARHNSANCYDSVMTDLALFSVPIYAAPGNHDIGSEFQVHFGSYYQSFVRHNDLFLILCPDKLIWTITGPQLAWLENEIATKADSVRNIFVLMHEVMWYHTDSIFQIITVNYPPTSPGSTNFFTEIEPLFHSLSNRIVFFAGDLGANGPATPFFYHQNNNTSFIGTGMGNGTKDNFVYVDVYADTIIYNPVAMNGSNPKALGELTDFSVEMDESKSSHNIKIGRDYLNYSLFIYDELVEEKHWQIFTTDGKMILEDYIAPAGIDRIDISGLNSGIYILLLENIREKYIYRFRIE